MRRGIVIWVLGLVVLILLPTAAPGKGAATATCSRQSGASFPATGAGDISFGPLRFVGLRGIQGIAAQDLRDNGGYKSQALLTPGHTATVSIDPSARSFARLRYIHESRGGWSSLPHTVRFVSCSANRSASRASGKPVTFWSGFFAVKKIRSCILLTIRVDRRPLRHWRLPVGVGSCART